MKDREMGSPALLIGVVLLLSLGAMCLAKDAPPEVASSMIIKLLAMEKGISAGGDVSIHVIGSNALAEALSKAVGSSIGGAKLSKITGGDVLPPYKPSAVCLADASKTSLVSEYTRREKVASVTSSPDAVTAGIALGIGVGSDGKPEVLLNMAASKAEGLNWNPAILKVAKAIQ